MRVYVRVYVLVKQITTVLFVPEIPGSDVSKNMLKMYTMRDEKCVMFGPRDLSAVYYK